MKPFEILDISGDIGLRSFGKTVQEAFVNAAIGMYSLVTDTGKIGRRNRLISRLRMIRLTVFWLPG